MTMALAGWLSREAAVIAVPVISLAFGCLVGYLAQRSGFCSIGGFRDFFLFRHTRLLKGYAALVIGAFAAFLVFWLATPAAFEHFPWALTSGLSPVPGAPAGLEAAAYIVLAVIGGIGVGIIGVLLGGCPLRQLTMTSEGNLKALFFVIGMAIGSVIFSALVQGWVVSVMKGIAW